MGPRGLRDIGRDTGVLMNGRGRQYDEGDIESEDLDLGEDLTDQCDVRRPVGMVMPVRPRLSREEALQLDELARRTGLSRADIARAALRATLAAGELPAPLSAPLHPCP